MKADANNGDVVARRILMKLLRSAERNKNSGRTLSAAATAPSSAHPRDLAAWHQRLEGAERLGAAELVHGKGNRRDVILRVRLLDADLLARDLGVKRASVTAQAAIDAAIEAVGDRDDLKLAVDAAAEKWKLGEEWHRIAPNAAVVARTFRAAASLLDMASGTHIRVAAVHASGSSKFLENSGGSVAAIIKLALDLPDDLRPQEVWAMLGLVKYRHPICLRAPVVFSDPAGLKIAGAATPWSAVAPELAVECQPEGPKPEFVMTVENWTSFNSQCRDVASGAVVYTHGFPAPPVRDLIGRLVGLWPDVPVFHWGDVDAGGLLIAEAIEKSAGRPIQLHLMTAEIAERVGKRRSPLTRLARIAHRADDFGDLARYLVGNGCRTFEQEILKAERPVWRQT